MDKSPRTAIERKARALSRGPSTRGMRRALPSRQFLYTKKWKRIRNILLFTLAVELFLFGLNFRSGTNEFIPAEAYATLKAMFKMPFLQLFGDNYDAEAVRESLPYYMETATRFKASLIAFLSGVIICVAGTAFQTIFKNPIASPNMLGVSTGVSLGNVLFVLAYEIDALSYLNMRYVYCYISAAILVLIAYGAGKISGKRLGQFSVEGTILAGMMITQLGSVVMRYFQLSLQSDENGLLEIYTTLSNGEVLYVDNTSMTIFLLTSIPTLLPLVFLRFRFDAVAFDDMEMKAMGVSNSMLRTVGLVLGSMMTAIALIHCGDVGFLCMVIPFMCRERLQTSFREVAYLSAITGGIVSLAVRDLLIMTSDIGITIPAGVVTTLILLPLFIVTLIRRGSVFT